MGGHIKRMVNRGMNPGMSILKSQRIRLVNICAIFLFLFLLLYSLVTLAYSWRLGLLLLVMNFLVLVTWYWNHLGYPVTARNWLFGITYVHLFILAFVPSQDVGFPFVMIVILGAWVLIAGRIKWFHFLFAGLLYLLTIFVLESSEYGLFHAIVQIENPDTFYYLNLAITFAGLFGIGTFYVKLFSLHVHQKMHEIKSAREVERTIHYFSNSLFGKNTVDEILWDVTKNCIGRLGFVDCVIYLIDEERQILIQKAAFGNKNPTEFEIYQPIEIPVGKGIVGHVARTGRPVIVSDTTLDPRYIRDDIQRLSEIAVPLVYKNKILGVIDSEHPQKGFYTSRHLEILSTIASICANKISRAIADDERERARIMQIEAEKIRSIDELKTKLFTDISHELRTPLTLIMGTIEKNSNEKNSADWTILKKHTDRLLRLINQLLDLARLESGAYSISAEPGDIMAFLRMQISMFRSIAAIQDINILDNIPEQPLWLKFDKDPIEKIVHNILSNAIKFSFEHSSIFFEVNYNERLILVVRDQGMGISEAEQEKVFERFYHSRDPKGNPGTGIGLAIVKDLVLLFNGDITLTSVPGKGTTVRIELPLELVEFEEVENQESFSDFLDQIDDSAPGPEEQILVIEDDKDICDLIADILSPQYQVQTAMNGDTGIKMALSTVPDLILCDIMMPGKSGLEVTRDLKEHPATGHIPIILLTARVGNENKLEGLKTGADAYLIKPFDQEELRTRIRNLLDQRLLLRQRYQKILTLQPADIVITDRDEQFIKDLMSIVNDNMDNSEFGVQDICVKLGMSRMQLYRKTKKLTDQSVAEFIRGLRLQRAACLLKQGEMVSQVAYSVGYTSLSNFSKIFKNHYGCSPSEFNG